MIKRYSECCCYQEDPNGGLVEYEDHMAEVGRLLSLLQECMDFACPNGETPTSDLACRIAAVLDETPAPRQASNRKVCGPAPLSPTAEKPDAAGSGRTELMDSEQSNGGTTNA